MCRLKGGAGGAGDVPPKEVDRVVEAEHVVVVLHVVLVEKVVNLLQRALDRTRTQRSRKIDCEPWIRQGHRYRYRTTQIP